jgi:ferric-dicitrate binding protein FerR (iron transport regulator)
MKSKNTLSQWIDGKSDFPETIEGKETFEKIKTYSAQLKAPDFDKKAVFEKIQNTKSKKSNAASKTKTQVFKIAAIFIVVFGVLAFFHQTNAETIKTAMAETTVIALPDDSQVLLQPGSELSYNAMSWFLTREVSLDGEAFFEVAKGKSFTVNTQAGQVEVLGTKFNVKVTSQKLNVVCYEGRVKATQNKATEVISANEFVVLKNGNLENKSKIQLNKLPTETSYYHIIDEEFLELVKDVERYYNVRISIEGLKIKKHFTGKLPKNNAEKALEIISKTFQLKLKTLSENNFIFVDDAKQ